MKEQIKAEVKSGACVLNECVYVKCPEWADSFRQKGDESCRGAGGVGGQGQAAHRLRV